MATAEMTERWAQIRRSEIAAVKDFVQPAELVRVGEVVRALGYLRPDGWAKVMTAGEHGATVRFLNDGDTMTWLPAARLVVDVKSALLVEAASRA